MFVTKSSLIHTEAMINLVTRVHRFLPGPALCGPCRSLVVAALLLSLIFGIHAAVLAQTTATKHASDKAPPKGMDHALDGLVQRKEYPALERQLKAANLGRDERAYYAGILADRSNHIADAIAIFEKIIPDLKTAHPHQSAIALRTLASDYFRVGRYAESCDRYIDLRKGFAGEFTKAELQAIDDNLRTIELLRDAAPQSISGSRNFRIPVQRDPTGDLDVPVEVGEMKQWWIFDTGANISTIAMSSAKQFGLTLSKGSASTQSGATGAEVPLRTAVIPELILGGAVIHNVAVLVMDNKALNVPIGANKHYQIQGILGYPVLAALGSFMVTADAMNIAPESVPSERSSRLYVEELTPLLEATVAGRELLFGFDTGAASGLLL